MPRFVNGSCFAVAASALLLIAPASAQTGILDNPVDGSIAGPVVPGDPVWIEFAHTTAGTPATGCAPADPAGPACSPSSGGNSQFGDAPPWTFTGVGTITVVDAFLIGERYTVYDNGFSIGSTSAPTGTGSCGSDPEDCLADPTVSSGSFALGPGSHSITIVPSATAFTSGAAYFRIDAGCTIELLGLPNLSGGHSEHGQSFTACASGLVTSVELGYEGTAASGQTLDLFNGRTVSGTPVFTQGHVALPGGAGLDRIDLRRPFRVMAGSQYTFEVDVDSPVRYGAKPAGSPEIPFFSGGISSPNAIEHRVSIFYCVVEAVGLGSVSGGHGTHGQSFTPCADGFVTYIEIGYQGAPIAGRTLDIFEGQTVSGAPVFSQAGVALNGGAGGWDRIELDPPFPVMAGHQYTFDINVAAPVRFGTKPAGSMEIPFFGGGTSSPNAIEHRVTIATFADGFESGNTSAWSSTAN